MVPVRAVRLPGRADAERTPTPTVARSTSRRSTRFAKVFEIADPATTRVEVPFEGTTLPAYFSNASKDGEPVPCVIMWNGLDSTKEHMYTSGWPQEMRERGISVLMVDCPGSGEALRFQDLKSRIETEDWAAAWSTTSRRAATSTPTGSGWPAGRWAATTARAPPRSRSG